MRSLPDAQGRLRLLHELASAFAARLEIDELVPLVAARCRDDPQRTFERAEHDRVVVAPARSRAEASSANRSARAAPSRNNAPGVLSASLTSKDEVADLPLVGRQKRR